MSNVRCPYCNNVFKVIEGQQFQLCPNCNSGFFLRPSGEIKELPLR